MDQVPLLAVGHGDARGAGPADGLPHLRHQQVARPAQHEGARQAGELPVQRAHLGPGGVVLAGPPAAVQPELRQLQPRVPRRRLLGARAWCRRGRPTGRPARGGGLRPGRWATCWASARASPPPAESPAIATPRGDSIAEPLEQAEQRRVAVAPGVLGRERVRRHDDPRAGRPGQRGDVPPVEPVDAAHEATAVQVEDVRVGTVPGDPQVEDREADPVDLRDVEPADRPRPGRCRRPSAWKASTSRRTCSGSPTSLARRTTGMTRASRRWAGLGTRRRYPRCRLVAERQGSVTRTLRVRRAADPRTCSG